MAWNCEDQRNPDFPESGFYALRLVKKGPEVGATIACIAGLWMGKINDGEISEPKEDPQLSETVQKVWLFGRKIDAAEYDFLLARYHHYLAHEPSHPFANPDKPINRRLMKPIE